MSNALPMGLEPNKSSDRTAALGVVEWQPCVAFDFVVQLGMQAPSAVGAYAGRGRVR